MGIAFVFDYTILTSLAAKHFVVNPEQIIASPGLVRRWAMTMRRRSPPESYVNASLTKTTR
jgi:hypothetical protein